MLPVELNASQRCRFKLNALNYCMIDNVLYRKNHDGMLLRCISLKKVVEVLQEFHFGIFGGHFSGYTMVAKILQSSFYWPSLYIDAFRVDKECEKCHRFMGR